jgi:hypothetical protein
MDKKEHDILQKLRKEVGKGHNVQRTLLFSYYSWITTIGYCRWRTGKEN